MAQMHTTERWTNEIRSILRTVPTDLALVVGYVPVAALLVNYLAIPPPLRALVGFPLIFFTPGYGVVAAAYPGRVDDGRRRVHGDTRDRVLTRERHNSAPGIVAVERLFLSFGMSVALVPLVGVGVWITLGGLSTGTVTAGLSAFTLAAAAVAAVRRYELDAENRFHVRVGPQVNRFREWLVGPSAGDTAVNVMLVGGLLIALATLTYGFAVPADGESYTTAMLVTEQDGEYVAGDYPTEFTAGESRSLTLTLSNHERGATRYTVVAAIERVDHAGGEPFVVEQAELARSTHRLEPDESIHEQYAPAPELVGENLRLSYYVYRGGAPDTVDSGSAYRDLHLWIDVTTG